MDTDILRAHVAGGLCDGMAGARGEGREGGNKQERPDEVADDWICKACNSKRKTIALFPICSQKISAT